MKIQETIKVAVDNNMPCLLVGRHGTGKSFAIREQADHLKKKLHRIIVTQETTPEDLVYAYELKDGATKKVKKELLKAVEQGDWVVIEEINMASPAVLTMLNGLLETDIESRYLRYDDKEVLPHKEFRLFATSNPTSYSGTNRMNDALLSRFLINKVEPDYKFFLKLISKEYTDEKLTKECKQFVSGVAKVQKNYDVYISPRELLVYAKLRNQGYDKVQALSCILDRLYDEDKEVIDDIASVFEVERTREEILVINEVELKSMVSKKTEELEAKVNTLESELERLRSYEDLMKKVREQIN
jgi:MoxR-like ATPase